MDGRAVDVADPGFDPCDEPPARRGLRRILQAYEDVEVVGEASTPDEAQELRCALTPDAIFLDVQLGREHGFDLIERLDPVPAIIVVTAHSNDAPRAFDVRNCFFFPRRRFFVGVPLALVARPIPTVRPSWMVWRTCRP
jgi:CheY-like chemotaxis protein